MSRKLFATICFGALLGLPGPSLAAEEGHSLEQTVVEMAQTPAQHAALAEHYRARAAEARAEAHRHESMARSYMNRKFAESQSMKDHCHSIAEKNEALAKDYDALAALHDAEAKKAR